MFSMDPEEVYATTPFDTLMNMVILENEQAKYERKFKAIKQSMNGNTN